MFQLETAKHLYCLCVYFVFWLENWNLNWKPVKTSTNKHNWIDQIIFDSIHSNRHITGHRTTSLNCQSRWLKPFPVKGWILSPRNYLLRGKTIGNDKDNPSHPSSMSLSVTLFFLLPLYLSVSLHLLLKFIFRLGLMIKFIASAFDLSHLVLHSLDVHDIPSHGQLKSTRKYLLNKVSAEK